MRLPNAPPGLPHHPVPALRGTPSLYTNRHAGCCFIALLCGYPCQINPIPYSYFSVGSDYITAFDDAADRWNAVNVDPDLEFQGSNTDPQIDVRDGWYFGDHWALAHTQCTSDGTFTGNDVKIEFNTKTMNALNANKKKIVAMHEIGHAYGLAHVSTNCHVMKQGTQKFSCSSLPHANEIAEVNSIN